MGLSEGAAYGFDADRGEPQARLCQARGLWHSARTPPPILASASVSLSAALEVVDIVGMWQARCLCRDRWRLNQIL
jgi:hypothetical protein